MADPSIDPALPNDPPDPPGQQRPLTYRSRDLLQGRNEVWIEHGDEMYRLRVTPTGKLYLTK